MINFSREKLNVFSFFLVVALFGISFFVVNPVSADSTSTVLSNYNNIGGGVGRRLMTQNFSLDSEINVSAFHFYFWSSNFGDTDNNFEYTICDGSIDSTDDLDSAYDDCVKYFDFVDSYSTASNGEIISYLPYTVNLSAGNYYLLIKESSNNNYPGAGDINFLRSNSDDFGDFYGKDLSPAPSSYITPSSGYSIVFKIYYDDNLIKLDDIEDDINYFDFSFDADFNGSGFLNFDPNLICDTDIDCQFDFKYVDSQIDKTVCIINDDDYSDYGYDLNYNLSSYDDYDDCVVLTDNIILNESLFLDSLSTTTSMNYTILVYDDNDFISEFYNLYTVWYADGIDTVFDDLKSFVNNFDTYDINSACQFVSTSTGSYADDFRYGVECGFNKSLYWMMTPKDEVYEDLYYAKDLFLSEFPINLFNILLSRIRQGSIVTDDINFNLPLFVGEFSDSGTITIWSSDDLVNNFGDTWLNIYNFFQTAIYFITIIYFISWISRRY